MTDTLPDRPGKGLLARLWAHLSGPAGSGLLLVACSVLAMLIANSAWREHYAAFLEWPLAVGIEPLQLKKPMLLWINDALMAVFFLLVALEIKREMVVGHLHTRAQLMLPLVCALAGIMVPALIYAGLNHADPVARHGWAIPAATDIAFALGILALLGRRVPLALKVLLSAIAVLDDLGAIVMIALFYTDQLSLLPLALAFGVLTLMWGLGRFGLARTWMLLLLGALLWVLVLKSGVHATLAGVATGLMVPLHDSRRPQAAPLEKLEHALHPWVTWGILPLFAWANAGVDLSGITLGLVLGKPIGIFGAALLARRIGIAAWPRGVDAGAMLGMGMLCGIGFTMSLFIGALAFEAGSEAAYIHRLGILAGSAIAAVLGSLWLGLRLRAPDTA